MRVLKSFLMIFGGVALLAGIGLVTSPKSAHALAAALVQVSNTAASPAITQGVDKLGSPSN